jgi:3-dehydroquinate synthase
MTAATHGQSDFGETVRVALEARSYDIFIAPGALDTLGARLAKLVPGARFAVITDANVERLHGAAIRSAFGARAPLSAMVAVPPGEQSKCFAELERLVHALLDARIERGDVVVAIGGGVVGDLAGFAAAILHRGVRYVQVPTSLLAQVDSAVGGKTGIDTVHGKNLVGSFHQPSLVVIDTRLLDSLPEREYRAGYAEVAKYGLIDDAAFFAWLEGAWREVFAGGPARIRAIATSCRAKARIVASDEREQGQRALLNLGHTFAHALEAATGLSGRLIHGEAVAIGMVLAFGLSAELGHCDPAVEARVARHLAAVGLPTRLSQIEGELPGADRLVELMLRDKKVTRGSLTLILAENVGRAFIARDVPKAKVREFLAGRMARQ